MRKGKRMSDRVRKRDRERDTVRERKKGIDVAEM
jgi:hypothetical protein